MQENRKNKWMSALTVLAALLVLGGVFLGTNALSRQTVLPQTQSGGGGVSSANADGEQVGQAEDASVAPVEYVVSNAFFEAWLVDWVGEVLPAGSDDEWDWKADAALRSSIRRGYTHAAGRYGQDVRAVLASEVEYEYRRLFREELAAHASLPLAEYIDEQGIYYISPYTAFTTPLAAQVYEVEKQGANLYLVRADLARGGEYVATAEALVELDETGPLLHSLTTGPTRAQAGEEAPDDTLDLTGLHFGIGGDADAALEDMVADYLLRATDGNAPESFSNVGTQNGALWLQAGLLRSVSTEEYEAAPLFWQQCCGDVFDLGAYAGGAQPLASLEAVEALAREMYGVDGLDPEVLKGYDGAFGYDENAAYYTVAAHMEADSRGIHVWQAESTGETVRVVATWYRLEHTWVGAYPDEARQVYLYGYNSLGPDGGPVAVWDGEEADEAWLVEALRAGPEWFVTVELALEAVGDGSEWVITSAERLEGPPA